MPKIVHLGFAGPVIENEVILQNAENLGVINSQHLKKKFNFKQVYLYNDFEIASYAIFSMNIGRDFFQLNEAKPKLNSVISICGPGTGLGRSTIIPQKDSTGKVTHKVWPCEGGSCTFSPINERLFRYYKFIQNKQNQQNQIILEHCATGLSIPYMYFFIKSENKNIKSKIEENLGKQIFDEQNSELTDFPNKEIFQYGMENKCEICLQVLQLFLEIFQNIIGDIMLQSLCYGGLFIIGNMGYSIAEYMYKNKKDFLREYKESRQNMLNILDSIPVYIIKEKQEMGLNGAIACAEMSLM